MPKQYNNYWLGSRLLFFCYSAIVMVEDFQLNHLHHEKQELCGQLPNRFRLQSYCHAFPKLSKHHNDLSLSYYNLGLEQFALCSILLFWFLQKTDFHFCLCCVCETY